MNTLYPVIIHHDPDNRYRVEFPDLSEAIREGETLEEALFNAAEILNRL
jgi:antitoxin HicB